MSHLRPAWPTFRVPDIKRRKFPRNKRYPICQNCTTSSPYIILCVVELHENHSTMSKERRKHIYILSRKVSSASRSINFFKCFFLANHFQGFLYMGYLSYHLSVYSKSSSGNPSPFVQINPSECCCLHSVYLYMK